MDEQTSKLTSKLIFETAQAEIDEERFRARVDAEKQRIREYTPWWYRWFPWQLTVTRR